MMRIPLSALPFGGGSVGTRIRNLRRKKTPLWLTAIAAFLCLVLSACLLTDQEVQQETETGTGANDGFVHNYMSYGVCGTEDTVYFLPSYYSDQICYVDKATGPSGPHATPTSIRSAGSASTTAGSTGWGGETSSRPRCTAAPWTARITGRTASLRQRCCRSPGTRSTALWTAIPCSW